MSLLHTIQQVSEGAEKEGDTKVIFKEHKWRRDVTEKHGRGLRGEETPTCSWSGASEEPLSVSLKSSTNAPTFIQK